MIKPVLWLSFAALLVLAGLSGGTSTCCHTGDLRAKSHMKGLEIGIKSYKIEYNQYPDAAKSDSQFIETRGTLLAILMAEDESQNSLKIRFFDPPPVKAGGSGVYRHPSDEWEFRDPWAHFYRVQIDVDGDGFIPNPAKGSSRSEPAQIKSDVILYSAGPDGDFSTWKDNVCSWK